MSNKQELEKALQAIHEYLSKCGWGNEHGSPFLGYRLDPITGMPHRGDLAFIIQTERDIYDYEKSRPNQHQGFWWISPSKRNQTQK